MSVMLALTCVALMWGWPVEAALISMTSAGVLRVGATLSATRADLVLPLDSARGIDYILLRVPEPKTRGRAARHQSARIDPEDVVSLISAVFKDYAPSRKLWSFSASTLRKRFSQLLASVGLSTKASNGVCQVCALVALLGF